MVKNELAELLGEPSEDDWLSAELECPLEGSCMEGGAVAPLFLRRIEEWSVV